MCRRAQRPQRDARQATFTPPAGYNRLVKFYESEAFPVLNNYTTQGTFAHDSPIKSQMLLFLRQVRIARCCSACAEAVQDTPERERVLADFERLAHKYRGQFTFIAVDSEQHGQFVPLCVARRGVSGAEA